MSYPLAMDEIPEADLFAELERRQTLRQKSKCDYCERPLGKSAACKFPERHDAAQPIIVHPLSFAELTAANKLRLPHFKNNLGEPAHTMPDGSDWTLLEWAGAACGEAGEAANIAKKFRRGDYKPENKGQVKELAEEIADNVIYSDILAWRAGINLGEAIRSKWNETSRKIGYELDAL